ncbi:PIG-L family deacetylase [Arachidicoccus ginsenosidivorans]
MRYVRIGLLLLIGCISTLCQAQKPPQWDAATIKFHLEKLGVLGRVLYLAAHPDDENTMLIAYLSKGKMYETAYLSCTRGDGGQNLIGSEQGSELGLIRTEELLGARSIDGGRQFFTTANDFGFSKSATETLKFWGHDKVLANVVWVIRKFQPDIIITRFPEDARAGHGHHWTSAILAHEAFKAAADPNEFKQQLQYVKPWQAKRLLWNTFNFGHANTTRPDQFHIATGGYNALLGQSYGEIAAASRSMHKSQGFGVAPYMGKRVEYFKTIEGAAPKNSLLDGVETNWGRIAGGEKIAELIQQANEQFKPAVPASSVQTLIKIYTAIKALPDSHWKNVKMAEAKQLIFACLGLFADATTNEAVLAEGTTNTIQIRAINRANIPVELKSLQLANQSIAINQILKTGEDYTKNVPLRVPNDAPITQPYWLKQPHPPGYYSVSGPDSLQLISRPMNPPAYTANLQLQIAGTDLSLNLPVSYRHTDAVKGELYQPLVIAPPVTINIEDPVVVCSQEQPVKIIRTEIKAFKDQQSGSLHLQVPDQFEVRQNDLPFELAKAGDSRDLVYTVQLKPGLTNSVSLDAKFTATVEGKSYNRGIKVIEHSHIPTITLFPEASARLVGLDIKTTGKNIAYIEGAGDLVPQALEQLGYQITPITSAAISSQQLAKFDAIITGIRAYNINPLLHALQSKLLDYVKAGGVLVTQYNKNGRMVTDQLGPYPFTVTGDRVTEEDAPVKWLLPGDPSMQYPNKLTPLDFDGWIQERGLYFTGDVDSHYRKLFEMHDKGSGPLDGSTIVCDYGKGKYVYSSLDFFRELPAGVPGAFRLFVNLLAKPATADK